MAYLYMEHGPEVGTVYELTTDTTTIGRYAECDIVMREAARVSRYHAQFLCRDGRYFLKDMGSRNGTFLNDRQIGADPQLISDGDRVRVCDLIFVFCRDAKPQAATAGSGQPEDSETPVPAAPDVILVEDSPTETSSVIMSKLDVKASSTGTVRLIASVESRLAALIEITKSLGRAVALEEVLPQVLKTLFRIFLQADRGFVVLESERGELIPRWTYSRKEGEEAIRISRTIVRHVMDSKEAVLSEDAASEWTDISQSVADLRIRSMMCAPLLDSFGNALGVIQLDTLDQRKHFQQEDLEVLASVAVQAGIAIDNAQLHDQALRQKELEHDLALAHEVQQAFLPKTDAIIPGYEVCAYYSPANHVGGDYYDYITMPDGRITILVADVVGHGVAAAMMMAKVSAEAKYCLASESHPATAMRELNERITGLGIDRFVTVVMLVLDPKKHEATIVNAGHMAPIWHRRDGTISEPGGNLSGLPIGILQGFEFRQATIDLEPGDILVMYTDGVNEAMDPRGKQYTIGRLRDKICEPHDDLLALRRALIEDVRRFLDGGNPADDMCFVCLQRVS